MDIITAIEIVTRFQDAQNKAQLSRALQSIVYNQRELLEISRQVYRDLQQLIAADVEAGSRHLEMAALTGRTLKQIQDDVAKARDLFIRALGQNASGKSYDIARLGIQKDIAICSLVLGDLSVAEHYAEKADMEVRGYKRELEYQLSYFQRWIDTGIAASEEKGLLSFRMRNAGANLVHKATPLVEQARAGLVALAPLSKQTELVIKLVKQRRAGGT
jgi:hypothetical protein